MKIKTTFVLSTLMVSTAVFAQSHMGSNVERYFESIRANPEKLAVLLKDMPKGGDLHNHESGATYAENMVKYAKKDNLCIDPQTFTAFSSTTCESQNLLNNAIKDPEYLDKIIDAWSMRHFQGGKESGHDHFFATFSKYGLISGNHHGEVLAEIVQRAGLENESYIETMLTADSNESGKLGKKLGWDSDFDKMRAKLLAADFNNIIKDITKTLDQDEASMKSQLSCGTNQAKIGCNVKVRYLYQVLREQSPEMVFAQLLAGFEAASKEPRVVGLNMVQPEDGKISMQDYKLQMQMVGYLHQLYPNVHVSLHAGELNNTLVPAEGLKFHINDAVNVAKADRIGHGVDIAQEDNVGQLLKEMADKHVMVEINLTSNAVILGVEGKNHPLPLYMQYNVPVSLSTDDEGVSRSNLTKEYEHAVSTFQLNYPTLKNFVRNSLEFSFLPGKALWDDYSYQQVKSECQKDVLGSDNMSSNCKAFLDANEKAQMQWDLEKRFTVFEGNY